MTLEKNSIGATVDERFCPAPTSSVETLGVRIPINKDTGFGHPTSLGVQTPLPSGERGDLGHPMSVMGQAVIRTPDTSRIRTPEDDSRVRCSRCTLGAFMSCPSGKPLPGDVLHNCAAHAPRKPSAPDARVLVQPGRVGLPMSCRAFREFIDTVHAEDRALGLDRLMRRAPKE